MRFNEYQKAIESIVNEGYEVLQISSAKSDEYLFFVIYKWQEGYFNTAQSIDFNTLEGVNITDFLNKNAAGYANHALFISSLNNSLSEGMLIRLQFTKDSEWYKWSSPEGTKMIR